MEHRSGSQKWTRVNQPMKAADWGQVWYQWTFRPLGCYFTPGTFVPAYSGLMASSRISRRRQMPFYSEYRMID